MRAQNSKSNHQPHNKRMQSDAAKAAPLMRGVSGQIFQIDNDAMKEQMLNIFQAESAKDLFQVEVLNWEYLEWIGAETFEEFQENVDIKSMHEKDMSKLDQFAKPNGRLLLAEYESQVVGMGCLRRIQEEICEIKRMFVKPVFRGKGIGKVLLDTLIDEAHKVGYPIIRLDSAYFMTGAHVLYRAAGFKEIEPYPDSDIPEEFHK